MSTKHLRALGVYGYDEVEPVILAALVSGDPLLLIGRAGTGKTFLLNSLSEALGLEHRHYNASLIAFDDLVGFPWPEPDGKSIRYIETPATVWGAESVLVDEINRCKPEHQNRLFSLIHERRIQGLKLAKLRYRWAAMNPAGGDQNLESYAGCEPLDPALADRFSFLVDVADWEELRDEDRLAVADPRGDGALARDLSGLKECLELGRVAFEKKVAAPDSRLTGYCSRVATILCESGVRISPRRVRQLTRNILAVESVSKWPRERVFRLALQWSLPQRSGLEYPEDTVIHAAHRSAWDQVCTAGEELWLHQFHSDPDLASRITRLLTSCGCRDTGTLAVSQLIASESHERVALFAFALFPALLSHPNPPVGEEGINDLCRIANELLEIRDQKEWRDSNYSVRPDGKKHPGIHPEFRETAAFLGTLAAKRRKRAEQLFSYLFAKNKLPADPREFEALFQRCVSAAKPTKSSHGPRSS